MFRPHIFRLLVADRFEREHRARISDAQNVAAALDEVRARRNLGYPPLTKQMAPTALTRPGARDKEIPLA
jgi:hypothetical protein